MSKVMKIKQENHDWTEEQVSLIKSTIAKGASDDELKLFLYTAKRLGLDPLAKQIHFSVRTNSRSGERTPTFITSIDGYRLVADRSGLYAGSEDPVFDNEDKPKRATVTVYKMIAGQRCPFSASARWEQYCPKPPLDFMWKKMPHLMLGKCAEALALRKAFPAELSGVYAEEEMHQAETPKEYEPPQLQTDTEVVDIKRRQIFAFLNKLEWEYNDRVKEKFIEITKKETSKLWTAEDAEKVFQYVVGEYNSKLFNEQKTREAAEAKKAKSKISEAKAAELWLDLMKKIPSYEDARKKLTEWGVNRTEDILLSDLRKFEERIKEL